MTAEAVVVVWVPLGAEARVEVKVRVRARASLGEEVRRVAGVAEDASFAGGVGAAEGRR